MHVIVILIKQDVSKCLIFYFHALSREKGLLKKYFFNNPNLINKSIYIYFD